MKQAEFAGKCGIERNYLGVNIKRGKAIVNEDGMIDDAHPLNKMFLEKCLAKPKKAENEGISRQNTSDSSAPAKASPKPEKEKKTRTSAEYLKAEERLDLESEKKRMEIEKLKRESRMADMQHEKALGKLLPTDPVRNLFMQTIKAYTVSFKQGAEKILTEFGKRSKLSRNDMAEIRTQLIDIINKASEEGISESKKSVMNIVREYSQTKKV